MSEAYSYVLTFHTAVNAATMTSATGITSEPYVFMPPTLTSLNPTATPTVSSRDYIFVPPSLSVTLAGPGAPTTSLPIEFPVASVITSGTVLHPSIGFTTYANPAEVSAAASAARSYYQQFTEGTTRINTNVPIAILSDTTPLTIPTATNTSITTVSPSSVSMTSPTITSIVTVPGSTSTSTLDTNTPATTSTASLDSSSALAKAKATATPTGSGSSKTTSIKKGLAIFCVLVVAANGLA